MVLAASAKYCVGRGPSNASTISLAYPIFWFRPVSPRRNGVEQRWYRMMRAAFSDLRTGHGQAKVATDKPPHRGSRSGNPAG
jgi:hypothetical protein